jgi:osmotically-inducible protein OsmY
MRNFRKALYTVMTAMIFSNCTTEDKDVSVKKDLAAKVKAEIDFVGVRFTINDGIVTLNGVCATRSALDAVHHKVKNLYGVNDVVNNLQIADVVIGKDWMLKRGVDSVLTEYPQVEAITKDSVVTLFGKVEAAKKEELVLKMKGLMPRQLDLRLADVAVERGK